MATLLKVLNNLADIKSAGGVALRVRTQARWAWAQGESFAQPTRFEAIDPNKRLRYFAGLC
jgi:hypothetical protein